MSLEAPRLTVTADPSAAATVADLSWTAVGSDGTVYNVFHRLGPGDAWTWFVALTEEIDASHTHGQPAGTTIYYMVTAIDGVETADSNVFAYTVATAPIGPLSLAVENLRSLVAASTSFQAWVGAAGEPEARANIHRVALPKPAGDRYSLAELQNARPFALVDLYRGANGFRSRRRSDGGGGRMRYDDGWRLVLMLEDDVDPAVADDAPEAEVRFLNKVGTLIDDLLTNAGDDAFLIVSEITIVAGPTRSSGDLAKSEGDFHSITLLLEVGH